MTADQRKACPFVTPKCEEGFSCVFLTPAPEKPECTITGNFKKDRMNPFVDRGFARGPWSISAAIQREIATK